MSSLDFGNRCALRAVNFGEENEEAIVMGRSMKSIIPQTMLFVSTTFLYLYLIDAQIQFSSWDAFVILGSRLAGLLASLILAVICAIPLYKMSYGRLSSRQRKISIEHKNRLTWIVRFLIDTNRKFLFHKNNISSSWHKYSS